VKPAVRCRFGRHNDEPVTMRPAKPWYVLLRCTRCGRDMAMVGDDAKAWIQEHTGL
jgi:hypothetical protein